MNRFGIILLIAAAGLFSCKEPFPPYVEPTNVLEASFTRLSADTVYVVEDTTGALLGSENMKVQLKVLNVYPQLLQGEALIKGRIECFVTAPLPRIGQVLTITRSNIIRPPVIQNSIAVPPGQYAELTADLPVIVAGKELYEGVPFQEVYRPDSTKVRTYAPLTVQVRGTVQIFERVQMIDIAPLTFQQTVVLLTIRK